MWNAPISEPPDNTEDVHFPRTILHAEIVWDYWNAVIRVQQCPGCCGEPGGYAETSSVDEGYLYPPLERGSHGLKLSGQFAWLLECSGQGEKLGDYGNFLDGVFICHGNILRNMQQLRITHLVDIPIISSVSSDLHVPSQVQTQPDVATTPSHGEKMVLHRPRGLSLPNNKDFRLLLRALATRLAGYSLVTTVIECSEFYNVDGDGRRLEAGKARDGGNGSADSGTFIPLCSVAVPRPWGPYCARRQQLKRIREHFYTVANLHHFTGAEVGHESADQRTTSGMVDISVMFGLDYLQELVRACSPVLLLHPIEM
ncbi:hypothetical protein BKA83DRAFT_4387164 [Pisolithus microcarpus]|nr:hypothetical protein BKA83DRAFT_4387164 [Pisolithus microcarpus]